MGNFEKYICVSTYHTAESSLVDLSLWYMSWLYGGFLRVGFKRRTVNICTTSTQRDIC